MFVVASLQDPYLLVFFTLYQGLSVTNRIWQKWWYIISKIRRHCCFHLSYSSFQLGSFALGGASCYVVSSTGEPMLWRSENSPTTMWMKLKVVPPGKSGFAMTAALVDIFIISSWEIVSQDHASKLLLNSWP